MPKENGRRHQKKKGKTGTKVLLRALEFCLPRVTRQDQLGLPNECGRREEASRGLR